MALVVKNAMGGGGARRPLATYQWNVLRALEAGTDLNALGLDFETLEATLIVLDEGGYIDLEEAA